MRLALTTQTMKISEIEKLVDEIISISNNFEDEAFTENVKLLREGFNLEAVGSPKRYLEFVSEVSELVRQGRILFIYSTFNRVCEKEGKNYRFNTPYQANIAYSAVMKKQGTLYLLDEDGHYREIFCTESFARFVEDEYWELIE